MVRHIWRYLFTEPTQWLFSSFFQPSKLRNSFKDLSFSRRIINCMRLYIPFLFLSYLSAIVISLSVLFVFHAIIQTSTNLLLTVALNVTLFMSIGIIVSILIDIPLGIAISIAMSITAGFIWPIIIGVCIGVLIASIAQYRSYHYIINICTLIILLISLLSTAMYSSILSHIFSFVEIIVLTLFAITGSVLAVGNDRKFWVVMSAVIVGIVSVFILAILSFLIIINTHTIILNIIFDILGVFALFSFFMAVMTRAISFGGERRITASTIVAITGTIALFAITFISEVRNLLLFRHFDVALPLVISYVLIFFRPHMYIADSFSMISTSFHVKRNPSHIFANLHRSALYWNELTYFPLPFLKDILLIGAAQDFKQTLQEVRFIIAERPRQIGAARIVSTEIALGYLERVTQIRDIAFVSEWLDETFPGAIKTPVFKASEVKMFAHLRNVSKEAARVRASLNWQARLNALQRLIDLLKNSSSTVFFRDKNLNKRITSIIHLWLTIAKKEREELENTPGKTQIVNVYQPGTVLRPQDALFVGRREIVAQLSESPSEPEHRSTFLLYGERRMGKSSLLRHLPSILGASYLPIFYDLQSPGMTSSVNVFLFILAEGIQKEMRQLGIKIQGLTSASLRDISRTNAGLVYELFDRWLDDVEKELEKAERTILICFDEYENLEEAGRLGHLNIDLLLKWLRGTIQNRSHVAFLFCGVRTFDELGTDWVRQFGSIRSIKVSFLQAAEARALLTRPNTHFPDLEIFSEEIIEEILHITRCHPFLLQATCSALINHLNVEGRMQTELQDITSVMYNIIRSWSAYFEDLWSRLNQQQRICLLLLVYLNTGSLQQLAQYSGIDEKLIRHALQSLMQRDLVVVDKNVYQIAIPLWNEWINKNAVKSDTWEQLHASILESALTINDSTIRQILFSKGAVTAFTFPHFSPTFVYDLLKTYKETHSSTNIEYQESTQLLRLHPQIVDSVQNIYTQLQYLMQITHSDVATEEFEEEVQKLFQMFSSSIDVSSTYKHVSKDFAIFLLHTQHVFENIHVPIPTPVLVSSYVDVSEKNIDYIRHLFMSGILGSDARIAILLLFCDVNTLCQAKQVLTKTLRTVFARDVVVFNQDDLLNIVCAKEPSQMLRHLVLSQVSLTAVDPYIITGATPIHFFFGREPQLREIAEHITTTSYAIIGGRRIGKTSTISCLHLSRLPARGFRTIYQDCSNISTYESFINNKIRNWQPGPPINAPITFGELFEMPPDDSPLVLLLDEADKLVPEDRKNGWRIFNTLRALINAKSVQVVLSGERTLREALKDPQGPLFNLANEMLLGPLDFHEVSELVVRPMKQLEIKIVDETSIVRHIYDFTSGHPNVVQRLCRRLINQLNAQERRRIELSDVVAITDDPSFQENDFLQTYWDAATPLERIITLVLSYQTRVCRLEEIYTLICEQIPVHPGMKETKEALDRLVDLRSLLKRSQAGYTFSIKAFPRVLLNTTTVTDLLPVLVEEYKELE